MRAERRREQISYASELIKRGAAVGPEELKPLSEKVRGEPIEPWILLRYGTKLYELYQKEDALTGEKGRLNEAKKVFEDIINRFPDNGSAVCLARNTLELIEKELLYEPPEALRKAYERATNPPPRPVLPKKRAKKPASPRKPEKPKEPEVPASPPEEVPSATPAEGKSAPEAPEPAEPDTGNK
jgi:hypothetical protein